MTEMTKILKLQQERARLVGEMRRINDAATSESRGFTAEETSEYEKLEGDVDLRASEIRREQDLMKIELELGTSERGFDPRLAQTAPVDDGAEDRNTILEDPDYRKAFLRYARRGDLMAGTETLMTLDKASELRDQVKGTSSLGGFLVPISFQRKLYLHALQAGTFRKTRAGEVALVTSSGETLQLPKTTVYGAAHYVGEGAPSTADDSSFGQISVASFTARRLVKISIELVEDNAVDLEAHLAKAIGQSIGRLSNTKFWVGSGVGEPTGLITVLQTLGATGIGKTGATGQTTSVTADDVLDLYYAVNPAYRSVGEFAMNDQTVKAIRKLKDSTGNYLWAVTPGVGGSLSEAPPDTLIGRPLWSDPDVPAMAAGAYSITFGDMQAYQIRDVGVQGPEGDSRPLGNFSVMRLNERFMDNMLVGFLGWHRHDGNLLDQTGAVKCYVNSAT